MCACSLCLAHPLQDHVRNVRFAADSRGVPHELSFFFSRIAPGGLAAFEPALHRFLRLAEHHRNVLVGMQPVADEEGNQDNVPSARQAVAIPDARFFFHENRVDLGVKILRADEFDLALDGLTGVFVAARAVAGDEQRGLIRFRRARDRIFLDDFSRAREQHIRHAVVRADGTAVINRLRTALLHAGKIGLVVPAQAEFTGDDFFGEVTFADEQRNDEDTRRKNATERTADRGLQFPETFEHLREKVATAQFIRVLIRRRSRIGIQRRAMADQNERSVGEAVI